MCNTTKAVLAGKCVALNSYIRKEERSVTPGFYLIARKRRAK